MQIRFEPVGQPVDPEELQNRFNAGWMILGQAVINPGKQQIATLDNPEADQPIPCNIWGMPEPTITAHDLLQLLLGMYDATSRSTVDQIAAAIFGQTITEMKKEQQEQQVPQGAPGLSVGE